MIQEPVTDEMCAEMHETTQFWMATAYDEGFEGVLIDYLKAHGKTFRDLSPQLQAMADTFCRLVDAEV